jgi:hypothetical protein
MFTKLEVIQQLDPSPCPNVGRCSRCHKFVIAEQRETHRCTLDIKRVEEIYLDWIIDPVQNENEDSVRVAMGLDGVLYRLIECKHNPPHTTKRQFTGCGTKQGLDSPVLEKA